MEELLEGFQEFLKAAGVSHRTRSAYCTDLRKYLRHATSGQAGPGEASSGFTTADVEHYIATQRSLGARPTTLRRSLAGIRRFFDYLIRRGKLTHNPARDVASRMADDAVIPEEQVLGIFRFLRLRSREVAPRKTQADELVLMMLLFVGLRQRHISMIMADGLQRQNGNLQLRLNGIEPVDIDGPVRGHLCAYLRRYAHEKGPLLSSSRGTKKLLAEISASLGQELDPRRLHRMHLWLRAHPERAYALLSRIEDIHE
jgi:site-specific recombinase XerD